MQPAWSIGEGGDEQDWCCCLYAFHSWGHIGQCRRQQGVRDIIFRVFIRPRNRDS